MKIAVNKCYGGFGLSQKAYQFIANRKNLPIYFYWHDYNEGLIRKIDDQTPKILYFFAVSDDLGEYCSEKCLKTTTVYKFESDRSDPDLIVAIETLGEDSYGECAKLEVVEIPNSVQWEIAEYDGMERVDEVHRSW